MPKFLFVLLLIPVATFAQTSTEPFKKANTIIISIQDQPEQAYKKIARILAIGGFGLANTDSDLGIITTDRKATKDLEIVLNVIVLDNGIRLTGKYAVAGLDGDTPIDFRSMKNSPARNAWNIMDKIAHDYNSTIQYTVN